MPKMPADDLTKEQKVFLEECIFEFSDRYTDADLDYKKIYDAGIPTPPIMSPWHGRPKLTAYRNRPGGSRDNRDFRQDNHYQDRDREYSNRLNDRNYRHHANRFRPF